MRRRTRHCARLCHACNSCNVMSCHTNYPRSTHPVPNCYARRSVYVSTPSQAHRPTHNTLGARHLRDPVSRHVHDPTVRFQRPCSVCVCVLSILMFGCMHAGSVVNAFRQECIVALRLSCSRHCCRRWPRLPPRHRYSSTGIGGCRR